MTAQLVIFSHDVEEKRLDVVIERFGTKEKFRKQTEVLAIYRILAAVHFKNGDGSRPVYLVPGWMFGRALKFMTPSHIVRIHVFETKFTDVKHSVPTVLLWIWRGVPCFNFVTAEINEFYFAGWSGNFLRRAPFGLCVSFRCGSL
jgi:hypothetical protein